MSRTKMSTCRSQWALKLQNCVWLVERHTRNGQQVYTLKSKANLTRALKRTNNDNVGVVAFDSDDDSFYWQVGEGLSDGAFIANPTDGMSRLRADQNTPRMLVTQLAGWKFTPWVMVESVAFPVPKVRKVLVGGECTITVTVSPSTASNPAIDWYTSDVAEAYIRITETDNPHELRVQGLTGTEGSSIMIFADARDGSGEQDVLLLEVVQPVTGITLTAQENLLKRNTVYGQVVTAVVSPENANDKGVTWQSNRPGVLSIDPDTGDITTHATTGSTTTQVLIIATANDGSGMIGWETIHVAPPVGSITIPATETLTMGTSQSKTLTATILPQDACQEVCWQIVDSSGTPIPDESVASVNSSTGVVTGNTPGTVNVRAFATDGSGAASNICVVTVKLPDPTAVTISPGSVSIPIYTRNYALSAVVSPTGPVAATQTVTWWSDNTGVVRVDPNTGVIEAVGVGTATITARSAVNNNIYGQCTVAVTNKDVRMQFLYHSSYAKAFGNNHETKTNTIIADATGAFTHKWSINLNKNSYVSTAGSYNVDTHTNCTTCGFCDCPGDHPVRLCRCSLAFHTQAMANNPKPSNIDIQAALFSFSTCYAIGWRSGEFTTNQVLTGTTNQIRGTRTIQHEVSHSFGCPDGYAPVAAVLCDAACIMAKSYATNRDFTITEIWCVRCARVFNPHNFN